MYRDDPLAAEEELRALLGDDAVDALDDTASTSGESAVGAAMDVLRVLQGWVGDDAAAAWFGQPQRRLDGSTPLEALCAGEEDAVRDAARLWVAAQA